MEEHRKTGYWTRMAYTILGGAAESLKAALASAIQMEEPDCKLIQTINTSLQFCQAAQIHCEEEGYAEGNIEEKDARKKPKFDAGYGKKSVTPSSDLPEKR